MNIFEKTYRETFIKRYDGVPFVKYFTYKDFPGMLAEPVSFQTRQGLTIRGNIYSYPNPKEEDLIVLAHGLGGGHRSYIREIELLCQNGYRVLSYDNVGCFDSEGEDIRGMSESLNDLDACMKFIKSRDDLKDRRISVFGHSWGGYAAGNILNYHKDIYAAIVISGFVSLKELWRVSLNGFQKFAKPTIYKFEGRVNPEFAESCSVTALSDTKTKTLIIHSDDDGMVNIRCGLDYVKERVSNENVKYLRITGKKHNPHYTADAVKYMNGTFAELQTLKTPEEQKSFMESRDYKRMTEQDPEIWEAILATLK